MLDTDPNTIKRKLKTKGFDNFEIFAKTYNPEWKNDGCDNTGNKNPRYDHELTFANICNAYKKGMNSNELARSLNTTYVKISNRIKRNQPNIKLDKNLKMEYAHIKVDSHYFEGREAISFNRGGWIGFAGWASSENIKPFCNAFCEWVDVLQRRRGKR